MNDVMLTKSLLAKELMHTLSAPETDELMS